MAITVNKTVVTDAIVQAYDVFAQLGYEVTINIEDIDLNNGISSNREAVGLQINHDSVKMSDQYKFLVQDSPSIYIKFANLMDGTEYVIPKFNQKFQRVETIDFDPNSLTDEKEIKSKQYAVNSINRVFNLQVIKLKL